MVKSIKRHGAFFVYIVQDKNGAFYTGYTKDVRKRIELHQKGRGAKFLKGKSPIKLVYVKEYKYYKAALNAERRIKGFRRCQKKVLIKRFGVDGMIG